MLSMCIREWGRERTGWVEEEMDVSCEEFSWKGSRELDQRLHEHTVWKENFFKGISMLHMLGFQKEEEIGTGKEIWTIMEFLRNKMWEDENTFGGNVTNLGRKAGELGD